MELGVKKFFAKMANHHARFHMNHFGPIPDRELELKNMSKFQIRREKKTGFGIDPFVFFLQIV